MEREEMIKTLMEKANVTEEEAKEALENTDYDILDAIVYLERKAKDNNEEASNMKNDSSSGNEENYNGLGTIIGKIFNFAGKVIKKGNKNYFVINKEKEKPIKVSLTISALLLIVLFVPTIVLLIIGLFCGYHYSISGNNGGFDGVNKAFNEISKSADNIKKDFKAECEK